MAQDYSKIFASGATSVQEWSDENYLKGWGYLGQTPPPYQLFDALFKRLDLKTQELNTNLNQMTKDYLPLIGGDMKGLVNLFASSTIPTPSEQDNSEKIANTEWVQTWVKAFISKLSTNLEVETQEDGHFSCPALGITGLMAQNGYICLGKLFGNLILQWGINYTNAYGGANISFPISFTMMHVELVMHRGSTNANPVAISENFYNVSSFGIYAENTKTDTALNSSMIIWISIGY